MPTILLSCGFGVLSSVSPSMGVDHTEPEMPVDPVGRRVVCGAERATVRYVGPVPPTTGKTRSVRLIFNTRSYRRNSSAS